MKRYLIFFGILALAALVGVFFFFQSKPAAPPEKHESAHVQETTKAPPDTEDTQEVATSPPEESTTRDQEEPSLEEEFAEEDSEEDDDDLNLRPTEHPSLYEKPISSAKDKEVYAGEYIPWLTGTLLAPLEHVITRGHYNIEPFLFVTDSFGYYGASWSASSTPDFVRVNPELNLILGLTEWLDVQVTPQAFYSHVGSVSSTQFGDLPAGLDFQVLQEQEGAWYPSIKFYLQETFPTGKYQKLSPRKRGTDAVGTGSFVSEAGVIFSHLIHIKKHHFLELYLNGAYNVSSSVRVRGLNVYGGDIITRGKVYPGDSYNLMLGFEYTFSQRWVLAMDTSYTHTNKSRFSGRAGPNRVGLPSSELFEVAPALEYSWSENMGLIAGAWFSVAGRNTAQFAGGAIAFSYYH